MLNRKTFLTVTIAALTGCASVGIDSSQKAENYSKKITTSNINCSTPKKFVDAANSDPFWGSEEDKIKESNFVSLCDLILKSPVKLSANKSLPASHTLFIEPTRYEMAKVAGSAIRVIYNISLSDLDTKKIIWKMETGIAAAGPILGPIDQKKADDFKNNIRQRLIKDALLEE